MNNQIPPTEETKFPIDSFVIQTHITTHQSIIARMATNSMNCKTWCVSLVSAIIALGVTKESWLISAIAILPLIVFWFLDAYYLKLEKKHRKSFDSFVTENFNENKIFVFESESTKPVWSKAVAPFYLMQMIAIIGIMVYFNFNPPTSQFPENLQKLKLQCNQNQHLQIECEVLEKK